MKSHDQLLESIQRFQDKFWNRKSGGRPPVGIYDEETSLPIGFLRQPFTRSTVCPEDLNADFVATEYECSFSRKSVLADDYMAYSAPWRGIPWLEAACGCPVRYSEGSLAPGHIADSAEALAELKFPASDAWLDCMRRETERIASAVEPDCWVSPSILRGPSDALAALRGMTGFFMDLHDNPGAVETAARRANDVLMRLLDLHYSIVPPKMGGYGQFFGYWAPGKTAMLQEDALGMVSPAVYRDIFMPLNAAIVKQLGSHVLFHFHSTGFKHYADVMEIPGLAGVEMSMETIGPGLLEMVPVFQWILERTRLLLQVCSGYEHLAETLRKIPHEGLYVIIPSKFIPTDQAYCEFVAANFG